MLTFCLVFPKHNKFPAQSHKKLKHTKVNMCVFRGRLENWNELVCTCKQLWAGFIRGDSDLSCFISAKRNTPFTF